MSGQAKYMLTKISANAPTPEMNSLVAPFFEALRQDIKEKSGVDFLAKCGDVFRPENFHSSKDGVANRSNHKTGRAFDYDQTSPYILVTTEPRGGKMYFHTYIKCVPQDGSKGTLMTIKEKRGFTFKGYVVDFTSIAASHGFERIPAWSGWQHHYNEQEFWHYQKMDGLTWDEAMAQIRSNQPLPPKPLAEKVYGLNDRGSEVQKIQKQLAMKKYLQLTECDGVFGAKTQQAVLTFQRANKLTADGLVGPETRLKLAA